VRAGCGFALPQSADSQHRDRSCPAANRSASGLGPDASRPGREYPSRRAWAVPRVRAGRRDSKVVGSAANKANPQFRTNSRETRVRKEKVCCSSDFDPFSAHTALSEAFGSVPGARSSSPPIPIPFQHMKLWARPSAQCQLSSPPAFVTANIPSTRTRLRFPGKAASGAPRCRGGSQLWRKSTEAPERAMPRRRFSPRPEFEFLQRSTPPLLRGSRTRSVATRADERSGDHGRASSSAVPV
jgi:hypothetical protein